MTPADPVVDAWNEADPTPCPVCGIEMCEDKSHGPPEAEPEPAVREAPETPRARLTAVSALDVMDEPPAVEIVDGIAWGGCLTVLVSESGAGKTFVLLDLAAAVGAEERWHGRQTHAGSVAYFAFEGDALPNRIRAAVAAGRRLDHVYLIRATAPISPTIARDGETPSRGELDALEALAALRDQLAATGKPPIVLVVIDTVRASMTGSEDSSEHVSAYLRAVKRTQAAVPGSALILAHHAGWQDGDSPRKRERGSSAWRGNGDGTLFLEAGAYDRTRGETPLTLRTLKVRDGEVPPPLALLRRRVDLGTYDPHGRMRTSCVIVADPRTPADRDAAVAAQAAAEHRALDLRVLRTVRDRPEVATSQDRLRLALGVRRDLAYGAVARLLERGWLAPPERQRHPYIVTPEGQIAIREANP